MFFNKYGNLILGIVFMIIAIAYYCLAEALPRTDVTKYGAGFMPKIVAGITFAIAAALAVISIGNIRKMNRASAPAPKADSAGEIRYARVVLSFAALAFYVLFFESLGFPVATVVYLLAQILLYMPHEKRNIPLAAGVSVAATLFIFYVFRIGLSVMLPYGVLGSII